MRVSRRPLVTLAAVVATVALVAAAAVVHGGGRRDQVNLYTLGIGQNPDGTLTTIPVGSDATYLPGSRVIAPGPQASATESAAAQALAQHTRDWVAAGTTPGEGSAFEGLTEDALLDMHALTLDGGAALAGYSAKWRYVWPRDAAFIAAAMSVTGHQADAVEILAFLQDVQHPDGTFEARYLPDGSGPPDDRGIQTDGSGWVLWALDYVIDALPATPEGAASTTDFLTRFRPMIDRSAQYLLLQVSGENGLPAPSSDYWEHSERRLTLGTAAPVLAGLEAAAALYARTEDAGAAADAQAGADRLTAAIEGTFGASGYGRYAGRGARDAATAFLLPPFQPEALPGAQAAWRASIPQMARPAGGLAPGATWPEATISWTPQTSLYAWTAASVGDTALATQYLSWIEAHRTPLGAIPEKVRADGEPAGVAPLAWTCAVVILTVAELERAGNL